MKKQEYLLGSFYILLVTALWVITGYFAQMVFTEGGCIKKFQEPFLATCYNNFLFTISLFFYIPMLWNQCTCTGKRNEGYSLLDVESTSTESPKEKTAVVHFDKPKEGQAARCVHLSEEVSADERNFHMSIQSGTSRKWSGKVAERQTCCYCCIVKQRSDKKSLKQTFWLGAIFCPIWFLMNYLSYLSLISTSLGSSTTLSSTMSSVFCLILSWIFLRQRLLLINLLGITFMIGGTVLIIRWSQRKNSWEGDLMALASAFVYACYSVLTKYLIGDGSNISMPLLFGLIGIANLALLGPLFLFFNYTGLESVDMPSFCQLGVLTGLGLGNVLADYFLVTATVLTTPFIVSVGLSMSSPATVFIDVVFKHEDRLAMYYLGIVCIIFGFLLVNMQAARQVGIKLTFTSKKDSGAEKSYFLG